MSTLEDKILGEKLEYYCSSSEDECNDNDSKQCNEPNGGTAAGGSCYRQKMSTNTGPKGVVQDWQNFKQMETEKREENERQLKALAEKLTMTTVTSKEDEERREQEELQKELDELMSEDFLQQFQKQRMAEMLRKCGNIQQFGKVQQLVAHEEFLNCIEKENKHTTVIIHIYDSAVRSCVTLNKCLDTLAAEYKSIKFAKIKSSVAGMSRNFSKQGLPALLVYKAQTLIGNFVRVTDDLSDDFFASDVESFLIENGIMVDKNLYN